MLKIETDLSMCGARVGDIITLDDGSRWTLGRGYLIGQKGSAQDIVDAIDADIAKQTPPA